MTYINPKFVLRAPLSSSSVARPLELTIGSKVAGLVIEPADWPSGHSSEKVLRGPGGEVTLTCTHDHNSGIITWKSSRLGGMHLLPPEHNKLTSFLQVGIGTLKGSQLSLEVQPYAFDDSITVSWSAASKDFSERDGIWFIANITKSLPQPRF